MIFKKYCRAAGFDIVIGNKKSPFLFQPHCNASMLDTHAKSGKLLHQMLDQGTLVERCLCLLQFSVLDYSFKMKGSIDDDNTHYQNR